MNAQVIHEVKLQNINQLKSLNTITNAAYIVETNHTFSLVSLFHHEQWRLYITCDMVYDKLNL